MPSPGKYPLVVDPVRLTKVLIDGGSSINIIYAETLGLLQIDLSTIRAGAAPFHGIIPRKRVQPLGTYHAVLGRPCYAKFMVVPNYTYLKLKMPAPNGVITVGSTY
jgi:hypothetical protein